MRSFLFFFLLPASALLVLGACGGGISYLGDLPQNGSDAGTADTGSTTPGNTTVDGGVESGGPGSGVGFCAEWQGTCINKALTIPCPAGQISYGDRPGCADTEKCCAPRCFATCPPGMTIDPSGGCTGGVACMPIVQTGTDCASKGGECELDNMTGLTDPCTASGRPIGAYACPAMHICCLP